MLRLIPTDTYKFIEDKLHGYKEIKRKIEEWELSVKYPENKQVVPSAGYISDPTANIAVKLCDPPEYICDCQKWVELIEQTQEFCRRHKNRIFDVWYGKEKQTVRSCYVKLGVQKNTFKNMRNKAVYFLLLQAVNAGLCKLSYDKVPEKNIQNYY